MCTRCEELEERVAWLESELGLRVDADEIHALCRAFGFAPGVAYMVRAMRAAHGRTMTHLQLLEAIPSPGRHEDRSISNINTLICRARKGLGRGSIDNVWGRGYRLTVAGVATVDQVLGSAAKVAA